MYFYACRFAELSGGLPDVVDFSALLAEMHKRPASRSPMGMFGFLVTTHRGRKAQSFPLCRTWEGVS